jgi:D-3-phosphoglycerate dehydrogenase
MPSYLVVVSDSVFPNLDPAREVLSAIGAELHLAPQATPEAILRIAAPADALLVTYATITAEMIAAMPRCRIISRFGIGVDNVDIAAATQAGIVVTKVPDYCIDEVSDHALALLLAAARKIPLSNAQVHAGRWEMKAVVPIHRLRGGVLGLVGFGRIPQLVAPKAKAFGLRVVAFDRGVAQDDHTDVALVRDGEGIESGFAWCQAHRRPQSSRSGRHSLDRSRHCRSSISANGPHRRRTSSNSPTRRATGSRRKVSA